MFFAQGRNEAGPGIDLLYSNFVICFKILFVFIISFRKIIEKQSKTA